MESIKLKSVNKVVIKKEKRNHSEMFKEEPGSNITRAHLLQLKKKCLTCGPRGRHLLGPVLRQLRACDQSSREKKSPAKSIVGWTITHTSQKVDSPPEEEEDDSEPSEAESDESVAEGPLNIRRLFLPYSGKVILEETSDSDDEDDF